MKALEAQVSTYSAALTALPPSDAVQASAAAAHMGTGHQGVLDIVNSATEGTNSPTVCRVDCLSADGSSASGAAVLIAAAMLSARGGNIGWLQFPSSSGADTAQVPMSQEAASAVADTSSPNPAVVAMPALAAKGSVADQIKQLDSAKLEVLNARAAKVGLFVGCHNFPRGLICSFLFSHSWRPS